ncbi:MAG: hypothetical protein Q8Q08_05310 [Candidatus Omnitrophota bacterium]|nr:hypothetical protein [Candidatus Omnitrophota bacterium]MDZ4242354.1 hypothetical protein [Candidatus Omnitrophota bacterium]
MKKRIFGIAALLALLAGCAPWVMTTGKEFEDKPRGFAAVLPDGWMRYTMGQDFLMTRDGVVLNEIAVQKMKFKDDLEFTKKKFRQDMLPVDLADAEIDNFKSNGGIGKFAVLENAPVTVGGQDGFRLAFSYETVSGLKVKGIHCGFIHKDWVYRIRFTGAAQHYYGRDLPAFERFIQSFRLL